MAKTQNKCELCGGALAVRNATAERPYRYEMSGLDNVLLAGIEVRECKKCGAAVPVIPKIADLHRAIVKYLIFKKDPLTGKEIRFLRKNAGITANHFAALLGIDPAHLSRIENGKTEALGSATDKLARAIAGAAGDGDDVRKILMELATRIEARTATFRLKQNHWGLAA
jgi:putative transcriptional regulator